MTRDRTRARVVILDPDHWDAFEWLALALRHRGVDVVRLVPATELGSRRSRRMRRLLFGSDSAALPDLGRGGLDAWAGSPTVDIQGPDDLVDSWRSLGAWPTSSAARRVPTAEGAALLHDKYAMDQFASALGITVPRTWQQPPPDHFPLVVKRASGAGGRHVRVVVDREQLAAAVDDVDPDGRGGVFFEEHIAGHVETFGGVADSGRLVAGATYRAMASPKEPLAPAERVEITDSQQIWEQVALLCRELDYTGFLCVDFMVDASGTAFMIDVNPRVFGSWLAMQESGIDLLGAYLALFGLGASPTAVARPSRGRVRMVRHAPRRDLDSWEEWTAEARSSATAVRGASRILGKRYLAIGGARTTLRLGRSAVALAVHRD